MSYSIVWGESAINAAAGFLKDDANGLSQLLATVDLLADNPRPDGTTAYGSSDLRRMYVGRYRVLYEITDTTTTVAILHLGRTL
ncbi:type II toxin-antitoxin system RelE/ParE family toxin [Streptomyces sp. MST-110588]|uniref:type II toxin-antitoxin system RelE family toxin n=1 Tax=Streptomyces sp. MST-110588 TaxID=2833628 RepID=UPI001F5CD4DE|nr:type II toxin-antitoxin system RelE/ParE family toxin [Streptomyces sp. MST-110588]UNO39808.1 type II toxin-antitoxin system RelE/ParE family toxin [Streptomyces sp. MST-110588]